MGKIQKVQLLKKSATCLNFDKIKKIKIKKVQISLILTKKRLETLALAILSYFPTHVAKSLAWSNNLVQLY